MTGTGVTHRYRDLEAAPGLWLRDVLKDLGRGGHPETDVYGRFRCKDGSLPIMPLAPAMAGKGLIANRNASAPQVEDWQPLPGSETASNLEPTYVSGLCLQGD